MASPSPSPQADPSTGKSVNGHSDAAEQAETARKSFEELRDTAKRTAGSVGERLTEIREYASYYLDTQIDLIKAKGTRIGIYAGLGVVGLVFALAVMATAAAVLVHGIAGGLGEAFGRQWLGDLVTGLGFVLLLGIGAFVALKVIGGTFKRKLMAKYEQRHQNQRSRFGTDVLRRSGEAK